MTVPIKYPPLKHIKIERGGNILNNLIHGCEIIDRRGNYTYLNKAALKKYPLENRPQIGNNIFEYKENSSDSSLFSIINRSLKFKESGQFEEKIILTDGSVGFFMVFVQNIPEGAILLSIDITKQKSCQNAKEYFFAFLSQELRTPLANLKWTLDIFSKEKCTCHKDSKHLDNLLILSERLNNLGRNLCKISSTQNSSQITTKKHTSLCPLIEISIKNFQKKIEDRKQSLKITLSKRKTSVFIDPLLFAQSLENLLEEASDYAGANGEVQIKFVRKIGYYEILIRGNKFFKSPEENKDMDKNPPQKNLKIFIAKAGAEANGGKIHMESDAKKSKSFLMSVPIASFL